MERPNHVPLELIKELRPHGGHKHHNTWRLSHANKLKHPPFVVTQQKSRRACCQEVFVKRAHPERPHLDAPSCDGPH